MSGWGQELTMNPQRILLPINTRQCYLEVFHAANGFARQTSGATVFLLLLCNDKAVLGPWRNGPWLNLFTGAVIAWNISYAKRGQRRGALLEAAARARGDRAPEMPA